MKVFGGNGHREQNSDHGAPTHRTGGKGGNDINDAHRGNNTNNPKRGATPPPKQKKKGGKGVLIALIVIAVIVGGVYIYWQVTTEPPDTSNPNLPADPEATVEITDTDTREVGHYYTVLVVGIDQLNANTDTIMVARYDAVERKVNIVSIPRDTLVNVPQSVKKINAVYSNAEYKGEDGIEALMDEVENICGFRPDNYVFINTDVFVQCIDAIGGVFFDVPCDMNWDDVTPDINYEFHIHIDKGYQFLSGENAMKVFRFRKNNDGTGYGMGDIDRLNTQHDLIKAIAGQALKLNNLPKLFEVAQIVSENSQTDLTSGNIQWYAEQFLSMSTDDINIMTLVANNSCTIREGSYVSIKVDEWLAMVNEFLNPLKASRTVEDCNILYQISPDSGYNPEQKNYAVTNGGEIAGGLDSFYCFG